MAEIRLEGITFRYGRRKVLQGLDWSIHPGVTGLLGENGAGKTTLMSVLVGLRTAQAGSVTIEARRATPRHGFVPQRFSVPGEMLLVDAVSYAAWLNGVDRGAATDAATKALQAVNLDDLARSRVRALSGGQRQRLGIAAGLAHDPDVLVLDEPTVGLDVRQRDRVLDVIEDLGETGRNVLLSTHMLADVAAVCDRIGVLVDGRIRFDGTPAEIASVAPPSAPVTKR